MPEPAPDDLPYSDGSAAALAGLDLAQLRPRLAEQLASLMADSRVSQPRRLLLTGSGDSLFAARAVAPALRRWSGLPVQVFTALEFARYEVPLLAADDLVVGVSNSGSSSRTREAIGLANARGSLSLGVTGSLDGPLADLAARVLYRPVQKPTTIPENHRRVFLNMSEYFATLLALYDLGLALGETRGRVTGIEAADWRRQIDDALAAVPAVSRTLEPETRRLAAELGELDTFWVLGAGPSRGSAEYSAAKGHEQLPLNGIAQDLEEWAHLQYFLTLAWRERSTVLLLAPPGNSLDRAEELVQGIHNAGGRALVASHPTVAFPDAYALLPIDVAMDELLSPILYHLPAQLLVLSLAERAGVTALPLRRQDDYWLIRGGLVRDDPIDLH